MSAIRIRITVILLLSLSATTMPEALAQAPAPDARFTRVMTYAREANLHQRPLGEIMQAVGEQLIGTPYVAGMLDAPEEETLLAPLDAFDCVLLVESVLALARGIAVEDYRYETYLNHIEDQRYRGGRMDGYCSRLHYFSEWIADNEARNTVRNLTRSLGGEPLEKDLRFMGEHRESYPRFARNDSLFQGVLEMEERLADLELYFIPQDRIRAVYEHLRAGDIIATATHIDGLDVTHTGLVYDDGSGGRGFLHASTKGGVKVSPDLQTYIENNKVQVGIVVARPVDHR